MGGATARDVALTWIDNATNETGYSVERRRSGGSWAVIAIRPANAVSYTDANADTGTFEYRVRAVRNTTYSAYSNTATAVVYGLPTVTLTSPTAGMTVTDSVLHIRWSAYQVSNVEVKYSLDQGDTWINLNQTGGIATTSPLWGDFPWTVPAINADSVLVWVHQYQTPGFGAQSGYFSIRRAVGAVRRSAAGPAVAGLFRVQVTPGGCLFVAGGRAQDIEVLTPAGVRVARLSLGAGTETAWRAPHAGTYIVRPVSSAGTAAPALRVSLVGAGR